jgi:hypothetical protein
MAGRANWMWVILPPMLALAVGCAGGGRAHSYSAQLPGRAGGIYHDAAGWMIRVPGGWHVVPFRSSRAGVTAAGAQVSNVRLPAPSILPGFPVQTSGLALPANGISLVIATDNDPQVCRPGPHRSRTGMVTSCQRSYASPPLTYPGGEWDMGSASAARDGPSGPIAAFLWFKASDENFSAAVKTGATVPQRVSNELSKIITSFRD